MGDNPTTLWIQRKAAEACADGNGPMGHPIFANDRRLRDCRSAITAAVKAAAAAAAGTGLRVQGLGVQRG